MTRSTPRRSNSRFSIGTIGLLCILGLSGPSQAHQKTQAKSAELPLVDMGAVKECAAELYAYSKVETLARELGKDADVVGDAVDVLGAQLEDCLDYAGAEDSERDEDLSFKKPTSMHSDLRGI